MVLGKVGDVGGGVDNRISLNSCVKLSKKQILKKIHYSGAQNTTSNKEQCLLRSGN